MHDHEEARRLQTCTAQTTFRWRQNSKPVIATFDVAHASSDGGALLLTAIDGQLGLTAALAGGVMDPRAVSRKVWGRGGHREPA